MLEAAHKGYLFQDLVTAIYLSKGIIKPGITITADVKSSEDDRFDDLKIESISSLELIQIKRSDCKEFDIGDLSSDRHDLRLDRLYASWKAVDEDRKRSRTVECLILTNWRKPEILPNYLLPTTLSADELPTGGLSFKIDLTECAEADRLRLCRHLTDVSQQDLDRFLAQLTLVLEIPAASLDLNSAGALERSLLGTLKDRIGVGVQPNEHISPIDAASRLVHRAAILRSNDPASSSITGSRIAPLLGLVTNFGALPQDFPFVESEFLDSSRRKELLEKLVVFGSVTVLRAGPGSGKSWELTNHFRNLQSRGVKVASHYCYLSPDDESQESRITRRALLGNLIRVIRLLLPDDRAASLPLYAATEKAFHEALKLIPESERLVIFVDGLDHISRVRSLAPSLSPQETDIVNLIASLKITSNVAVVIGSQPGSYLDDLASEAFIFDLPPWEENDCSTFLRRRLKMSGEEGGDAEKSRALYFEQTQGNPLFCNYLAKEVAQSEPTDWNVVLKALSAQPLFSGDVKNYYSYLFDHIPVEGRIILKRLGMLDFGVTAEELGEMSPIVAPFLVETLRVSMPVLSPITTSNGIRIYHESFRRFVLEQINGVTSQEWSEVASWLEKRGFFKSNRSFLYLFPYLQRADRTRDLLDYVDEKFVTHGVAAAFASRLIERNLKLWLGVATETGRYDLLGLGSELQNSLNSLDWDLHDYSEYAKAASLVVGSKQFGERMIFEGRPVYPQEDGLKICAVLHSLGGFAPWAAYFSPHARPRENQIGDESLDVSKARFLGRIVLDGIGAASARLVDYLKKISDSDVDCRYLEDLFTIFRSEGGSLVELREAVGVDDLPRGVESSLLLIEAKTAGNEKCRVGSYEKILEISTDSWQMIEALDHVPSFAASPALVESFTRRSVEMMSDESPEQHQTVRWLFELRAVARSHPGIVEAQRTFITGDWWYRNWLRFVMDFSLCEAVFKNVPPEKAFQFLEILSRSTEPFLGKPRACDLYWIRSCIHWTIERCLRSTVPSNFVFRKSLVLLREMSFETTTYLQSSAGGPLIPSVLFEICTALSDDAATQAIVAEEMRPLVARIEMGSTYPQIAHEKLRITTLAFQLGLVDEAKQLWEEAARYLTAYGERKDSTLDEISDPTIALHEADPVGSYDRQRRCQSLAYSVCQHTDGKGTRHLVTQWFSYLATTFPRSAGEILSASQGRGGGPYDYRIEEGFTAVLESIGSQDHQLWLAALLTVHGGLSPTLESRVAALRSENRELPASFSHLLTAKLQGDSCVFSEGSIATLEAQSHLFAYPGVWVPSKGKEIRNETAVQRLEKTLPVFSESGRTTVAAFKVELDSQMGNYEVAKDKLKDVSKGIIGNLCNARVVAEDLLEWLGNHVDRTESSQFIEILAEIIELRGWSDLAARAFALAFCRSRGGGGWLAFGDSKKHSILRNAFKLESSIAETVLRNEVVRQNGSRGVTQHLIEGLVSLGRVEEASQLWEQAFKVIHWRLPDISPTGPFNDLPELETTKSAEEILVLMIFSRLSNPENKRRNSAMMAATWCIQNRPLIVGKLLDEICQPDLRIDVLIVILRLIECYEMEPWRITGTGEEFLSVVCREGGFLPAQIAKNLLVRSNLPAPSQTVSACEVAFPAKNVDSQMLEFLDLDGILSQTEGVWPGITEEVMSEVQDALRNESEDRERWKSLVQMSNDSTDKNLPLAGVVHWPEVVFSRVVNRKLKGLREQLWRTGNPESILETQLAKTMRPDVVTLVKYQFSRIPRPNIPRPDQVENRTDEFSIVGGSPDDWIEIGRMEYFHSPPDEGFGRISQTTLAISGLVHLPLNARMPEGLLPLSKAPASVWEQECIPTQSIGNPCGPLAAILNGTPTRPGTQILGLASGFRCKFHLRPTGIAEPIGYEPHDGKLAVAYRWWECDPVGGRNGIVDEYPRLQGGALMMRRGCLESFMQRHTGKVVRIGACKILSNN